MDKQSQIILYNGSHGTCVSMAESIVKNGFFASAGLKGKGAYFWENTGDQTYLQLAKSWYTQQFSNKKYSGQKDSKCSIITANASCLKNEFLDLEDRTLKRKLQQLVQKLAGGNQSQSPSFISGVYDKAIQAIQLEHGISIKVMLANVTGPALRYCNHYNYSLLGSPSCIIVLDCANISNVTRLPDEAVAKV